MPLTRGRMSDVANGDVRPGRVAVSCAGSVLITTTPTSGGGRLGWGAGLQPRTERPVRAGIKTRRKVIGNQIRESGVQIGGAEANQPPPARASQLQYFAAGARFLHGPMEQIQVSRKRVRVNGRSLYRPYRRNAKQVS